MLSAIRAEKLYDGIVDQALTQRTVVIADGRIEAVVAGDPALPADAEIIDTPVLAPGFIDLQINGAADRLFNDAPGVATLDAIATGARAGGAAWILPTFITAHGKTYLEAIDAVDAAIEQGVAGILGIHLEGPFLSPKRPGIHDRSAIRRIMPDDLDFLTACKIGVRLITLAPEEQPAGTIQRLADAGWTVFAGHSEATADDMKKAADEGLSGVTHLFNAMSQIQPREPGVVGSTLDDARLFAGIIADGLHVHPANLRLAAARLGSERLCLVTDAMPTLGGRRTSFILGGREIRLRDGQLTDANGTLAGAHLSMIDAVKAMTQLAGVPLADAFRMAATAPARALGLDKDLGRIAAGYRAGLTLLDETLAVRGVALGGHLFSMPNRP
ncbi:MAG: N-acetylglucosamine-6-phosphate deacetylase [Alphaproteobacteria bacterium]